MLQCSLNAIRKIVAQVGLNAKLYSNLKFHILVTFFLQKLG